MITRRAFMGGLGAVALVRPAAAKVRLAPVHVARDRILRTIVGLRPFRPSGFVVRGDNLSGKFIVHNYGHGGCGVTLSWGTGQMAAELVPRDRAPVAVLGAGAVGLATARLLQQRGHAVTIYAKDLPPNTTSDVAGARWYPFDLFDKKVVTPAFLASLWVAARASYRAFRALPAGEYGIFDRPTYCCQRTPIKPESLLAFDSPVHDLLPGLRDLSPAEKPVDFPVVRTFRTLMIEPAIYLPALVRAFRGAGGMVVEGALDRQGVLALSEKTVVNCTGLGAGPLFGDEELYPIKGQLTILRAQPEVDYVALPLALYMFPRKDGVVLGGTFQHHVSSLEPDLAAEQRILEGHARFFAELEAR